MNSNTRTHLVGGILLILLGTFLFAARFMQIPNSWYRLFSGWPMILVGIGFLLLLIGLFTNSPDTAIPASIVTGLGFIFLYQKTTGNWESWSYVWALIPGFVGFGLIISGVLKWQFGSEVKEGLRLIFISAILFMVFGSFLGGLTLLGNYWPVLLILLGIWILIQNFMKR